jgi:LmbE family N-acetylglucosaminyl deacetylase
MGSAIAPATWGVVEPAELERIVVVQPHFDDGVMGAGHVLGTYPASTCITVMGGPPAVYPSPPTEWDSLGGFVDGDDVVAIRAEEDRAALAMVDAVPVRLRFVDHQYLSNDQRATADEVAAELGAAIDITDPTAVFVPMGLANPDHAVTHAAALLARADRLGMTWFAYEDAGYKHLPGLLAWRVATLFKAGIWPTPAMVPVEPDANRKRRAFGCYRSQVAPLERDHALAERLAANVPEQYWRLDSPPVGWEGLSATI